MDFVNGATVIGTATGANPYSVVWASVPAGTYTLTAVATDSTGATGTTGPVTLTVTPPSTTSATFVRTDVTTQGTWVGTYGSQGYGLTTDPVAYPAYAQVTVAGANVHTWAASTSDGRALQHASGGGRVASTWYAGTSFTVDVNLTDGATHQVALYAVDWDATTRAERVDVLDAVSGVVLDSQLVSGFHGGQYLVWNLSGHVTLRVTNVGTPNVVVSGLFFDAVP